MKALIKNPWFWVALAAAIVVTALIARSKTGDSIATSAGKIIPLSGTDKAAAIVAPTDTAKVI